MGMVANEGTSHQVLVTQMPAECDSELKAKDRQLIAHNLLNTEEGSISNLLKVEDHSDLRRLTAHVIMFIERLNLINMPFKQKFCG